MNPIKEEFLDRLYKLSSVCMLCGSKNCVDSNRKLPSTLKTNDVLKALDIDDKEYPKGK